MKSDNEIKERNRNLGIVTIEDLDELYDKLLDWDKKDFIEKHIVDSGYDAKCNEDKYDFDDIYEFVKDHDEDDILDELGEDSCFIYLRNQWHLRDFIDALREYGYSYSRGYSDQAILNELDLSKEDTQISILKQLDKKVIENFLKYNTKDNG